MTGLIIDSSTLLMGKVILEPPFRSYSGAALNGATGGAFSYVAPMSGMYQVEIGRYCSIGDSAAILSSHPAGRLTTSPFPYQAIFAAPFDTPPVTHYDNLGHTVIGNDVWIGSAVKIKSGVRIGDGAVLGAGSVVTKDVEPYTIVGGVAARPIRKRFADAVIERLQRVAWWQYNLSGLQLPWDDIEACLDRIEGLVASGELKPFAPQRFSVVREGAKIVAYPVA